MAPARPVRIRARNRPAAPRGFTLLEVLLALGLTLILLAAVYSGLDIYRKLTTAGADRLETGRIARALFRQMQVDIRSALMPEESRNPSDSETDEEDEDDVDATTREVDPSDANSGAVVGLIGDAQTLVINGMRPNGRRPSTPVEMGPDSGAIASELRSISYFLAVAGAQGLRGLVAAENLGESGDDSPTRGLAKLEGSRWIIGAADAESRLPTLAAHTRILAPEVDRLRFEYFDGLRWHESWDSPAMGGLPRAVRVTIGFRRSSRSTGDAPNGSDAADDGVFEIVVAIPLSEPPTADPE